MSAYPHPALRLLIIVIHIGIGISILHRPYLPELFPVLEGFTRIAPWTYWGMAALLIALGLSVSRPNTIRSMAAHLASGLFFLAIGGVYSYSMGFMTASATYGTLSLASLWLFGVEFGRWMDNWAWFRLLKSSPPRWFERRFGEGGGE